MLLAMLTSISAMGFLISSYFTAVVYQWIEPDSKWIPSFCRMEKQTCVSVVFTPRARVMGLPNSVLGQLFYIALIAGLWKDFVFIHPYYYFYICVSLATVVLGLYLTYSLLFLTRVPCKLCFASHGFNLVIFVLLLVKN